MTKVFDDTLLARAAEDAARALAARDPDTLAGRFSPHPPTEARSGKSPPPAKRTARG